MNLIKELNETVNENINESVNPFKILDITKIRGVNDILEGDKNKDGSLEQWKDNYNKGLIPDKDNGFSKQQMNDMDKLISQYKNRKPNDQDTEELIGNDLEMLEYNPDEVKVMVPYIVKLVTKP